MGNIMLARNWVVRHIDRLAAFEKRPTLLI
jgi:hypothetical protein